MDKKELKERYTKHFQEGGRCDSETNAIVQLFSDMLYHEKKDYVEDKLYNLLEENPHDHELARFVKIGERELLGGADRPLFVVRKTEKLYNYTTTVLLTLCLLLSPNAQIIIPRTNLLSRESYQAKQI